MLSNTQDQEYWDLQIIIRAWDSTLLDIHQHYTTCPQEPLLPLTHIISLLLRADRHSDAQLIESYLASFNKGVHRNTMIFSSVNFDNDSGSLVSDLVYKSAT